MSKALFRSDTLKTMLSHLKTSELESFMNIISSILEGRRKRDDKNKEKALLLKLNQAVLNKNQHERVLELSPKVDLETISSKEQKELDLLLTKSEELRNKRVEIMIELARLKSVSLPTIMKELGLKPLKRA